MDYERRQEDVEERLQELERDAERMDHDRERLDEDIEDTRREWEDKQEDRAVPGAQPDPGDDEESLPGVETDEELLSEEGGP